MIGTKMYVKGLFSKILLLVSIPHVFPILFAIDWQPKTPMPTARSFLGTAEFNNKIFAFGGRSNNGLFDTLEIYDITSNTWTAGATMPNALSEFGVAVVNSRIYIIGGYDTSSVLSSVFEYDPAGDTWTTKSPMPTAREGLAVAVFNNRIYAIGGDDGTNILTTVEEYDPALDAWTTKTSMPTQRTYLTAENAAGRIYAIGGCISDATPCGTVEEYDPVGNTWSSMTDMPTSRYGLASGAINDKIYSLGGFAVPTVYATVESFDPAQNVWSTETAMLTARWGLAVETVVNKLYAIGGQTLYHSGWTNMNDEGVILIGIKEDNVAPYNSDVRLRVHPNPFSKQTVIHYALGTKHYKETDKTMTIQIYDITGRVVKSLLLHTAYSPLPAEITWDRTDNDNHHVPSGIYIIELKTDSQRLTRKLSVIP